MDTSYLPGRRRTRMISFRVSDGEFEQLKAKLEAEGARSISDYVRLMLWRSSNTAFSVTGMQLSDDIQVLGALVRRVTELVESLPQPRQTHQSDR